MKHKADGLYYIDKKVVKKIADADFICKSWKIRLGRLLAKQPDKRFVITYEGLKALTSNRNPARSLSLVWDIYLKYSDLFGLGWRGPVWVGAGDEENMLTSIMKHLAQRAKREGKL